jgi:eukaryotic-like serine/threonine-protein kinase
LDDTSNYYLDQAGKVMNKIIGLAICALLMVVFVQLPTAEAGASDSCQVLFDFGDGNLLWVSVEPQVGWTAFNLTSAAADSAEIELGYLETDLGVYLYSIDGVRDAWPEEYWHFRIWNSTNEEWVYSLSGAGATPLGELEAIAWNYVKDRSDWSSERPLATPDYPYPWTMFRHDLRNLGWSGSEGPCTSELAWEMNLGSGAIDSAMVAAQGGIYVVTAGLFNWTSLVHDSMPKIYRLNPEGDVMWEADYSNAGYQLASPLLVDNLLILPSTDGKVYAFHADDGRQAWNYSTGFSYSGVTSSPVLHKNRVIVGGGDGTLYALELNGTLAWSERLSSSIYFSSPAVREDIIYIGTEDALLHAVASDGSGEIWNVSAGGKVRSSPLLLEDMIVITYGVYDGFVAVDGGIRAFSYNGTLLWDIDLNATSTSPALTPNGIAVTSVDGLSMVSPEGEMLWSLETEDPMKGSPAVSGEAIYVTTWGNQTTVMAVGYEGELLWQTLLSPDSAYQYSMCSPILVDSVLYVSADNGYVYAFDDVVPFASFIYEVDGLIVSLDASSSYDAQGELQYSWELGDGNMSEGMIIEHAYAQEGNYTVTLVITDDEGTQDRYSLVVQAVADEGGEGLAWWQTIILLVVIVIIIAVMRMTFKGGEG